MKSNNYNEIARETLNDYRTRIRNGERFDVSISNGNDKMGPVKSVSILPILTCPAVCRGTCGKYCYAEKLARLRPFVLHAWARNTAIMLENPEQYWLAIDTAAKATTYFRFHVAGDIFGFPYFERMIETARNNPHCKFLAFTKAFNTVNTWIAKNGELPENLKILFSGEKNLKPENPYNLPETTIYERNENPDPAWLLCGGNCFECGCRGLGCWQARPGDVIAFKKH